MSHPIGQFQSHARINLRHNKYTEIYMIPKIIKKDDTKKLLLPQPKGLRRNTDAENRMNSLTSHLNNGIFHNRRLTALTSFLVIVVQRHFS